MFYNVVQTSFSPSLRILLKVWVLCRCQNRIEKYYHHDGEQWTIFFLSKSTYQKTGWEKKNVFIIFVLQ